MGRFLGGRFGDTVDSTVTLDNAKAIFTQYDYYYMKREGGLANPSGFSVSSYAVDGTPTGTTQYNNVTIGQSVTLTAAGRHVVTLPSGSETLRLQDGTGAVVVVQQDLPILAAVQQVAE